MLELVALAVTIGALLVHTLGATVFVLGLWAGSIGVFVLLWFRTYRSVLLALLVGCALFVGGYRVALQTEGVPADFFGKKQFDATVVAIDRKLSSTTLTVATPARQKIQLFIRGRSQFLPGDTITVSGSVEAPGIFLTDAGRMFDYPQYLKSRGVVALMYDPAITLKQEGSFSLVQIAVKIRFWIAETIARYVVFPVDGLLAGMLVGYQGALPQNIQDLFRDTGVLHVLVLSGYNITLLAGFLGVLFRSVPFRLRTVLTLVAIVLLVVISGAGVASVRAGIMGGIALFAGLALRTYRPLRALTIAYLLFFFVSSESIFSDPGFHLSFLATAYMVLIMPKVMMWVPKAVRIQGFDVRELFVLALSIPLFMLPYTMYFAGVVPLATVPANILLALVVPCFMVLGIVVVACSWVAPLATVVGVLLSHAGTLVVSVLQWLGTWPMYNTPAIPWWGVVISYGVFVWFFFRNEIRRFFAHLQNAFLPRTNSDF